MKAKDVMRKRVIVVRPHWTVGEVAKIFTERHITGPPVVDGTGSWVFGAEVQDQQHKGIAVALDGVRAQSPLFPDRNKRSP